MVPIAYTPAAVPRPDRDAVLRTRSTPHRQTATAMSISGAQVSSRMEAPLIPSPSMVSPPSPATPNVGRATSISSKAAEKVRVMTMTVGESRTPD